MLTTATGRPVALIVPALVIFAVLAVPADVLAEGVEQEKSVATAEEEYEGKNSTGKKAGEAVEERAVQLSADPLVAEDRSTFGGFRIWGDLQVAYRSVDLNGSEARFTKDYGLESGVRILDSKITLVPAGTDPASWFDRIELFADGLGGDKYESWGVRANKTNRYRFNFRTREVDYFWQVTGDPHSWDLTRRNSDADLTVNLTDKLELTGTYRGFHQDDGNRTPGEVQGGESREPLDQTGSTWGGGLRWRSGTTLLFISQDFHKFTDNGSSTIRGLRTGVGDSESSLTYLEQREVREIKAPTTRGGFQTRLSDGRIWLSGDILSSNQELTFQPPDAGSSSVSGEVDRKILHGNLRALWKQGDRFSLSGEYRRRSWDQLGELDSGYKVTVDQFVFGAEWAVVDSAALFGEVGTGTRKQSFDTTDPVDIDSKTDAMSYKIGGRFRSGRAFDAEASYARGDIDNPFTRVAPGTANTVNVKLRARPGTDWQISGTYRLWDTENDTGDPRLESNEPVQLRTENWGLNVSYGGAGERGRWAYAGYTRLKYDSNVPIRFVAGSFGNFQEATAEYVSTDDIWSVGAEYRVSASTPLALYGHLNYVSSAGTVPLTYYDTWIGARYILEMGMFLDVQARFVEYLDDTELPSNVDDYTGTILTLALGYRF